MIDSEIVGLSDILNAVGMHKLKQLIIIYNKDLDADYDGDEANYFHMVDELFLTDFSKFQKLQYFEYSIYNGATDQSMSSEEMIQLCRRLPD